MIELSIRGDAATLKKKEVREIIRWMSHEMGIDRNRNPIWINLHFKKYLKKYYGHKGTAIWEDTNHRPREFTIECDADLSKLMTTRVLLHEVVHVKQYVKGQ